MSDYVHNKVVRLPFPKDIKEKCNTNDVWDCEQYLKELLGELWDHRKKKIIFHWNAQIKATI